MAKLARNLLSLCLIAFISTTSAAGELPALTQGQTVYVPIYSEILYGNANGNGKPDRWPLSAMLSIRNTDPKNALELRSVRYYATDGTLLREYPAGTKVGPFATIEFFVEHRDKSGGSGANFLVEWNAEKPINAPIVEAVHAYMFSTRGLAFTSPGQPLHVD